MRIIVGALAAVLISYPAFAGAGGGSGSPITTVPEPASIALLVGGVAVLLKVRSRRK